MKARLVAIAVALALMVSLVAAFGAAQPVAAAGPTGNPPGDEILGVRAVSDAGHGSLKQLGPMERVRVAVDARNKVNGAKRRLKKRKRDARRFEREPFAPWAPTACSGFAE